MEFEIIGSISDVEVIARGVSVRQRAWLRQRYGRGRWRKMKGVGMVELSATKVRRPAELHWYEAHGFGAIEHKVKRFLD